MHTALIDSRRLMGPNLYHARHGAVLEVAVDPAHAEEVRDRWSAAARHLLDALGWRDEAVVTRAWAGGLGLFVTAPLDGLLAATEVTEQALAAVESGTTGPWDDTLARLRVHLQHERRPRLRALADEATRRGLQLTFDDDRVAVGGGHTARQWPITDLPDTVDWRSIANVPVVLVTGSNGKTTTTRLLAAMGRAAGRTVGHSCTDGVWIGDVQVESGDWSGPAGARRVVQDPHVGTAILETARGGILRRGLGVGAADAAIVTRVAADHFGEYGIHDVASLGEAKLVVARGLRPGAPCILNADDDTLVAGSRTLHAPTWWFSLDPRDAVLRQAAMAGAGVATVEDGQLRCALAGIPVLAAPVAEVPIALGGAATHNIANALAAMLGAVALGLPATAVAEALRTFGLAASDNPGRLQVRQVHGVTVIVDFVHNPDGWAAMLGLAGQLRAPGGRLLLTLGQAGDRTDADLDEMARVVWEARPDVIVLKEMEHYLRGRPYGQVTERLGAALRAAGAPTDRLLLAPDEVAACRLALDHARAGDLVIMASHANYREVLALVEAAAG